MTHEERTRPSRMFPLATIERCAGNSLLAKDGTEYDLNAIFNSVDLCEQNPVGWRLVKELLDEIVLQRKILKEVLRQEGMTIRDSNEYYRSVVSFANKVGISVDDLKALTEPLVRQVFEEMLNSRPKQHGKSRAVRNEDH